MGFQLFETSGTFNPASWGLKAGDMLYIVAIGGGGGGSHNSVNLGSAGSASSFGSVVSAAGGAVGVPPALQTGSCQGSSWCIFRTYTTTGDNQTCYIGGSGGDGWYPGQTMRMTAQTTPIGHGAIALNDNFGHSWNSTTSQHSTASTVPHGHFGQGNALNSVGGSGGIGYGAGGGSKYNSGAGGNSGCLVRASYQLPNTNTIAVTVGSGGTGYSSYGGGGARGCVCVFW